MSLDNSECEGAGVGPLFRPLAGLEPLHRHQEEAARQQLLANGQWEALNRLSWDLIAALWGRIEDQVATVPVPTYTHKEAFFAGPSSCSLSWIDGCNDIFGQVKHKIKSETKY